MLPDKTGDDIMTKILIGCLVIGVIAALLAWKTESVKVRIIIGIGVAVVLAVAFLLALILGGDS